MSLRHHVPDEARGSRDAMLGYVQKRGRQIKRRRDASRIGGASLALLAVAFLGFQIVPGPGTGPQDKVGRIVEPGSRTSPTPGPAETPPPASRDPLATQAPIVTAAPRVTPTPAATPAPVCTDREVQTSITTDKTSYARGETVQIRSTITNVSGHACQPPKGATFGITLNGVPRGAPLAHVAGSDPWAPGAQFAATGNWETTDAESGTYRIQVGWTRGDDTFPVATAQEIQVQ